MPLSTPPIDHDALRVALVRAVIAATGLDQNHVLEAEAEVPDAPRPDRPYMVFKLTTVAMRYGDDCTRPVPGGSGVNPQELYGPRLVVASFNSYGTSHEQAYAAMGLWQASLALPAVRAILDAAGISVLMPGAIKDLTALLDTAYEGRAQMDLRMAVRSGLLYDAGSITSGEVVGSAQTDSGTAAIDTGRINLGGGH